MTILNVLPFLATLCCSLVWIPGAQSGRVQCDDTTRLLAVDDSNNFNVLNVDLPEIHSINNAALNELREKCGDYHYHVELEVMEHLFFLISPGKDVKNNVPECNKKFLVHSVSNQDDTALQKEFLQLDHGFKSVLEHESNENLQGSTVQFGKHQFKDIVVAYFMASVSAPGSQGKPYNYVWNNCGDFLANIAVGLSHGATRQESKMIAQQMVHLAPEFLKQAREHVKGTSKEYWSDEELYGWLVETRLSKMYENQRPSYTLNISTDNPSLCYRDYIPNSQTLQVSLVPCHTQENKHAYMVIGIANEAAVAHPDFGVDACDFFRYDEGITRGQEWLDSWLGDCGVPPAEASLNSQLSECIRNGNCE